jgi:hypothetical protein
MLFALLLACSSPTPVAPAAPSTSATPAPKAPPKPPAEIPSFKATTVAVDFPDRRIIAIGDVHGDWQSARKALELAELIDKDNQWTGGRTLVVQVGDQLDRGDEERVLLDHFERLSVQAAEAGGAFLPLLGNHEIMNAAGDLRYVTPTGFAAFQDLAANVPGLDSVPEPQRGRVVAFRPGGVYAMKLADHRVIAIISGNVFVHGGVLPEHVRYGLDRINSETATWLKALGSKPAILDGDTAPVWTRIYSDKTTAEGCDKLIDTLQLLGADRMIVAHTPQPGINAECGDRVWRVDVGLSKHYGGPTEVLEIIGPKVRVLKLPTATPAPGTAPTP